MPYETFLGIGYLIDEQERINLSKSLSDEHYGLLHNNLYNYDRDKWFFGEKIYEFDTNEAKSLTTLATLPALTDNATFAHKYGNLLSMCGLSIAEINENWSKPNVYIIVYTDF